MRLLISICLFITSSSHAHELPPLIRPASLSPVGVKLWETLIEGHPHWRNWIMLMRDEPLDPDARAQMQLITGAVEEQLASHKQELLRLAIGNLFRRLESDPRVRKIGVDLSNPGQAVRDSFARFERRVLKDAAMPYQVARRRALAKVRQQHQILDGSALEYEQEREVSLATLRYLQASHRRPAFVSREEFERWKAEYAKEQVVRLEEELRTLMRAELADPKSFSDLTFARIGDGALAKMWIREHFTMDNLPPLSELADLPPPLQDLVKLSRNTNFTLYGVMSPGVVMGVSQTEFPLVSREGLIYDVYEMADMPDHRLYQTLAQIITWRRQLFFNLFKDQLVYAGADTSRLIATVTSRPSGLPFHYTDSADWMFNLFTADKHYPESRPVFDWIPNSRKLIYSWQMASWGPGYYNDLTMNIDVDYLPEIEMEGSWPDDFYSADGLPLLATSNSNGNRRIEDVNRAHINFRVINGSVPWSVNDWRLPSVQTVNGSPDGEFAVGEPSFVIQAMNSSAQNVIRLRNKHYALLIPAPNGYKPSVSTSVRVDYSRHSVVMTGEDLKLRHDPERAIYLLDLGTKPAINAYGTIAYAVDPAWPSPDVVKPLRFTRAQLRPVIAFARSLGADPLANALELEGEVSAGRLAQLLAANSEYSVRERKLGPSGLRAFVSKKGKFSVQCSMAAEILKTLLTMALADHPLRDRIRVEVTVVMPFSRVQSAWPALTQPLHAKVDILIDGVIRETWDGTPFNFEAARRPYDRIAPAGAVIPPPNYELKFDLATTQLRAAISTLDRMPRDQSIPIFDILRAAERVAKNDGSLDIINQMEAWGAQLDRMVAYLELNNERAATIDHQTGAKVLLSKPAVAAAHLVIEASRVIVLTKCAGALSLR